jgi:4-aminobutyrate aminotransferase/(S)-3-amino-2-methylpropionate transaminase
MGVIRRLTEIPGPRSRAVMARRAAAVPRGVHHAVPIVAASARGVVLEDVDGNRYIDFAGGIGVVNVGHSAPPVVRAVQEQADRLIHSCFAVAAYESYISLAERLARATPGAFPKKTLLVTTGAEAVENAVKIARAATGRRGVLCFEDAFHGRTLLALSLTSKTAPYKSGMGPYAGDIVRAPYAYCYRCSYNLVHPSCAIACVDAIETMFRRYAEPSDLAAVIVEPALGEGGFVTPPPGFLTKLQALCRRHGILLIADEIQTGFGRTGRLFACEHEGVEPDLLLAAKSIAGGLPLAAVIGRAEVMDAPGAGGLGGTYAGAPVAIAAAHAVMDVFERGDLLARSDAIGARIEARMRLWAARTALVGDVRRIGAMVAMELVLDRATKAPARREVETLVRLACERGLILMPAGTFGNVIRILAPLVVSDDELDEGLDVLDGCLADLAVPAV